jgi:hypothetical protein
MRRSRICSRSVCRGVETLENRQLLAAFPAGIAPDVVSVTSNPGVIPNDGIDDTVGLQAVISANKGRIIYFPNGTYNISNTINIQGTGGDNAEMFLEGQSQSGVIIRLADNAAGFNDTSNPEVTSKAMFRWVNNQNNNFRNRIKDMSFNVGTGNGGAIALDFVASNYGFIENVTVTSPNTNSGQYGIKLAGFNGPAYMRNITVTGLNYGIYMISPESTYTATNITLNNQDVYGLYTRRSIIAIRNLNSNMNNTTGRAVFAAIGASATEGGTVTIIGGNLQGGAAGEIAIDSRGNSNLLARGITVSGYGNSTRTEWGGTVVTTTGNIGEVNPSTKEFLPGTSPSLTSLNLPITTTPDAAWDSSASNIAVVPAPTGNAATDTANIQTALNSGRRTVFLARGQYNVNATLNVPLTVNRIYGLGHTRITAPTLPVSGQVFNVNVGTGDTSEASLTFDGIKTEGTSAYLVVSTSLRKLIIRHCGVSGYRNQLASGGPVVYLEDVSGSRFEFKNQNVWIYGVNPETDDKDVNVPYQIRNTNANVWILGLKTEGDQTAIRTELGGDTEVLGGQIEPTSGGNGFSTKPIFEVDNNPGTRFSVQINFRGAGNTFGSFVRNTDTGAQLLLSDLDLFANGRSIGLFRFG